MTTPEIVTRVTTYLERHLAWFERALADLEPLEAKMAEESLERLAERQRRYESEMIHFHREHQGLLREWRAAEDIPETDRARVRALAVRAEAMSVRLRLRYEEGMALAETHMADFESQYHRLRRGKELLEAYRPGGEAVPSFVDEKA